MVGALKRWLGIEALQIDIAQLKRENLILAKAVNPVMSDAIRDLDERVSALESSKALTLAPEPPKISERKPAPKRVNWSQFRETLERVSEPQEDYADL